MKISEVHFKEKERITSMFNMKKLSAALACCLSIAVLASGCGNSGSEGDDEIVANVITSAEDGSSTSGEAAGSEDSGAAEGTSVTTVETEIVTDEAGEAVTGVNGNVITEAVTTQPPQTGTLSDEDIQAVMTATFTEATTIVNAAVDNSTRYAYNTLDDDEKAK